MENFRKFYDKEFATTCEYTRLKSFEIIEHIIEEEYEMEM